MKFAISSGHGKYVRGAKGLIDEVDEARRVVPAVAGFLRHAGHQVVTFNDDTSTSQNQNLQTIVNWHNSQTRDFDASVHFNAYIPTSAGRGCEVLYVTQGDIAAKVSSAMSAAGDLIDRGPKKRTDLYFLNKTNKPAILLEVCFVDAAQDVEHYQLNFDKICKAIADVAGTSNNEEPAPPPLGVSALLTAKGKCSWFGGPNDKGVTPSEGLAFIYKYEDRPDLFLAKQPPNTTGLARRLNPDVLYIACRWDYSKTPKSMLADKAIQALVKAKGKELLAWPADWGPNQSTGRVADLSPGLMKALGVSTDDSVEVRYPS